MNRKSFLTIICLTLFLGVGLNAQKSPKKSTSVTKIEHDVKVEITNMNYLGKTRKLKDLVPLSATSAEKKAGNKKIKKKEVANFVGRGKKTIPVNKNALPLGADPVRQVEMDLNKSTDFLIEPLVNINGLSSGSSPNDPTGDIGLDYYIQAVNATSFRVFDKDGSAVSSTINANTLWSDIGFSSAGDPIILFDQEVSRWIITEFPSGNQLLFAMSETSDPTGSWDVWNFSTPSFPDYPKYGVWNNCYVVTTNEQGNGILPAYFINRDDILNVVTDPQIQRLQLPGISGGPGFFVSTPVDWSGLTPPTADALPMVLRLNDDSWGNSATDQIDIFQIDIDWANSSNTSVTTTSVQTAPFNTAACAAPGAGFACIPQLDGGGIDGLPETIMNQPHYRNFGTHESLVLNFLVNANTPDDIIAGIRWMELRRMPGGNWEMYQEGTYSPDDGLHRFNGTMAMDAGGNIALAYNVSSPDSYPGLRYTGRFASDPLGEMTVIEYNVQEGGSANPFNRWGDYAHMSIDPVDDRTFWFTSEYRTTFNTTNTRIVSLKLERDTTDIGVVALNTPQNSPDLTANETIEIVVKNFGLDTQMVYNVGYIFENGTEVLEPINMQLLPDSTYTHTFGSTVDMSVVGEYEFKLFTSLADDSAVFNDTLRTSVFKFPRKDAGITNILGLDGINCADPIPAELVLTNFGSDTLTAVTINFTVNGNAAAPIAWTGSLAMGESENVAIDVTNLIGGVNEIIASSSMPNGEVDEVMANDTSTRNFDAVLDGVDVTLVINLDDWPSETTWEVADDAGNILFAGGPYPGQDFEEINVTWCLDPDGCYVFTIFDAYGDGICCQFGPGNYSILDADGLPLLQASGEFGSEESSDFCATFACTLEGDIDVTNESADSAVDGVIMISSVNGVGPFQYSIDGGQTFSSSNVFTGLAGGDYDIVILDVADCLYEETVTVATCAIQITADVTDLSAAGAADGSITINVTNGIGNIQYSTNGAIFGNNNTFTNLSDGVYTVYARDEAGCQTSLEVTVDIMTSLNNPTFGTSIEVLPNPTDGQFRINVVGLQRSSVFLPFYVYDISGKLLYESKLVRYDNTYTSEVSLTAFPAGTYLIRFLDENIDQLVKVVRN